MGSGSLLRKYGMSANRYLNIYAERNRLTEENREKEKERESGRYLMLASGPWE